jgi:hypothetical protein
VIPFVLVIAGLGALGVGAAILRRGGSRYRIGRLLAATPVVPIAMAVQLADGDPRYVAISGRIDSEDEFEDEHHRPLVLRRVRIQMRQGTDWTTLDEERQAVAFELREGLDLIGVDQAALDDGLVVVVRESTGSAADVPDRVPADTPSSTPVRLRIEQISTVEHAIVLGVPTRDPAGTDRVTMRAGMGRPLVLTTLERDEAMRVLAEGGGRRPLAAAASLAAGLVLITLGIGWALLGAATGIARAASPDPSPLGGDPRSPGEGPGLVGDPLLAIGLMLAIGIAAVVATLIYVRLTGGRRT